MPQTRKDFENEMKKISNKEEQINFMNNYATQLRPVDLNMSKEIARSALKNSRIIGYSKGIGCALLNLGLINNECSDYSHSVKHLEEAIQLLNDEMPESIEMIRAYNGLGVANIETGRYATAVRFLNKALELSRNIGNRENEANILINLGAVHHYIKKHTKALKFFEKSLILFKDINNEEKITINLINIGGEYFELGDFLNSLKYLEQAKEKSIEKGFKYLIPICFSEVARVTFKKKDYTNAKINFIKALELFHSGGSKFHEISTMLNLGDLYLDTDENDDADIILHAALKKAQKIDSYHSIRDAFHKLSKLNEKMSNYKKAIEYYKAYHEYDKKIFTQDTESTLKHKEAENFRNANKQLTVISEIGREIVSTLNHGEIFDKVYKFINSLMDATIFGIATLSRESNQLVFNKFVENGQHIPTFKKEINDFDSFSAWCAREKKEVIISDLENEYNRYINNLDHSVSFAKSINSLVFMPLIVEEEILGVLTVQSYEKFAYSAENYDALRILSYYISIAINNARQAHVIQTQNAELKILAKTDSLTGLKNRRAFNTYLTVIWSWTEEIKSSLSVLMIDIDFFKKINDSFGHLAGDYCLVETAKIISKNVNHTSDFVGRYGGEEFIVILSNTIKQKALHIAEKIRADIENFSFIFENTPISLTVSIGVESAVPGNDEVFLPEELIAKADQALYTAKKNGRNQVQ